MMKPKRSEASSKTIFKRTVVSPALYESLEKIGEFVNLASREAGFDESSSYKIRLAVDEACSNIIQHAYGGETASQEISCSCVATYDVLMIELRDHGCAFDPDLVPVPDFKAALEARSSGGLGLFFMRHLMDEVIFKFDPGSSVSDDGKSKRENLLILVKHKEKPA